ncbi:MAG TPA: hypothetical protein DCR94_03405 [Firmicutes bacterium]|nr:hypothetical protein [Bacillota bacterium]
MNNLFDVDIICDEKPTISFEATLINVKTSSGVRGIMANCDPVVAILIPSVIEIVKDNNRNKIRIGEGFLSFNKKATILVKDYEAI